MDTTGSQASQATEGGDEYKVRCPCGCNEVIGFEELLSSHLLKDPKFYILVHITLPNVYT